MLYLALMDSQNKAIEALTDSMLRQYFNSGDTSLLYDICDRVLHYAIGIVFFELSLRKHRKFAKSVFKMAKEFYVFHGDGVNFKHFIEFNDDGIQQVGALLLFLDIHCKNVSLSVADPLSFSSKSIDLPIVYQNLWSESPSSKETMKRELLSVMKDLRDRFKAAAGNHYRVHLDNYFLSIQNNNNEFVFRFMGMKAGYKGIDSLERLINMNESKRRIQKIKS